MNTGCLGRLVIGALVHNALAGARSGGVRALGGNDQSAVIASEAA